MFYRRITDEYEKFVNLKSVRKYYVNGLLDPVRNGYLSLKNIEATLGEYGYCTIWTKLNGRGMFKIENFKLIDYIRTGERRLLLDGGIKREQMNIQMG